MEQIYIVAFCSGKSNVLSNQELVSRVTRTVGSAMATRSLSSISRPLGTLICYAAILCGYDIAYYSVSKARLISKGLSCFSYRHGFDPKMMLTSSLDPANLSSLPKFCLPLIQMLHSPCTPSLSSIHRPRIRPGLVRNEALAVMSGQDRAVGELDDSAMLGMSVVPITSRHPSDLGGRT